VVLAAADFRQTRPSHFIRSGHAAHPHVPAVPIALVNATALIADDEEAPRARLIAALAGAWPQLRVVAEATNGLDAWDAFLEREPQVCFLDVRMPGLTGLEVAQRIASRAHVVFVTAAGDRALADFDAGAVDYVLKPVDTLRLASTVERVMARIAARPADLRHVLDRLVGQIRRPAHLDVIQTGVGHEAKLIRVQDVVFFEADARHTRVVHLDGDALLRTPLKELLGRIDPAQFWQIHRAFIVNRRHIAGALRVDDGNMTVTLRGRSETLPVGRHFQALFEGPQTLLP
jgi:DNA-binding LytR/AlgR family response regulator